MTMTQTILDRPAEKVLVFGFARTGTMSIRAALRAVGYEPCVEKLGETLGLAHWQACFRLRKDVSFGDCAAICLEGLSARFPKDGTCAAVMLDRPAPEWWASYVETVAQGFTALEGLPSELRGAIERLRMREGVASGLETPRRTAALEAYRATLHRARRPQSDERIMAYRLSDGWAPLLQHLGLGPRDETLPHLNARAGTPKCRAC